jgi:hypothetical protein
MRERAGERAAKYLGITSDSLRRLRVKKTARPVRPTMIHRVSDFARDYARDAKYYLGERKPVTALACIAYAEGLIDALKFLELADF